MIIELTEKQYKSCSKEAIIKWKKEERTLIKKLNKNSMHGKQKL